jgi:hypothetical protein
MKRTKIQKVKNRDEPIWVIHTYVEMSQGNSLYSCFKQTKKLFFLLQNKKTGGQNQSCLGFGTSGRGKRWGKSVGGWIRCKCCVQMNVNGKMRPVETIPGMRGEVKWKDGGSKFKTRILYCKNFCKCHNVPLRQHNNQKKKKLNRYKLAVSQKDSRWSSSAEICYNTTKAMLGEHPE